MRLYFRFRLRQMQYEKFFCFFFRLLPIYVQVKKEELCMESYRKFISFITLSE